MLVGMVNYMLCLIYMLDKNNRLGQDRHWMDQISRARIMMQENIESDMTVQDIAETVGAGFPPGSGKRPVSVRVISEVKSISRVFIEKRLLSMPESPKIHYEQSDLSKYKV